MRLVNESTQQKSLTETFPNWYYTIYVFSERNRKKCLKRKKIYPGLCFILYDNTLKALSRENLTLLHAKNKDADQPAHPCSLISAFVVCLLENILS